MPMHLVSKTAEMSREERERESTIVSYGSWGSFLLKFSKQWRWTFWRWTISQGYKLCHTLIALAIHTCTLFFMCCVIIIEIAIS